MDGKAKEVRDSSAAEVSNWNSSAHVKATLPDSSVMTGPLSAVASSARPGFGSNVQETDTNAGMVSVAEHSDRELRKLKKQKRKQEKRDKRERKKEKSREGKRPKDSLGVERSAMSSNIILPPDSRSEVVGLRSTPKSPQPKRKGSHSLATAESDLSRRFLLPAPAFQPTVIVPIPLDDKEAHISVPDTLQTTSQSNQPGT